MFKRLLLLALVMIVLLFAGAPAVLAKTVLVKDGKPQAVIFLPAEPEEREQLAAEESAIAAPVDMAAGEESGIMATLTALPARFMSDFKVMGIGIALILIIGGFVWMFVR